MPKISDLTAATSINPGDDLVIVQSGATKKIDAYLVPVYARTAAEITGGVTPTNYQYEPGDVRRYGAVGDGTGDMGSWLQQAHDGLPADGGTIYVPPASSYYLQTTTAAFTKPVRLLGVGWYASEILSSTASITFITTTSRIDVENMHFTALTSARGDSTFIKTLSSATNHGNTSLINCYFDGASRCYWSELTAALQVHRCIINPITGYGLYLENLTNPDTGDSFISNNTFSGGASNISIYVPSTSGININNNKFNTAVTGHILISSGSNNVGNFLIANNSFEGHVSYAIKIEATTGVSTKNIINGNQFSSFDATHVIVGSKAKNTNIFGNVFNDTNPANGVGISILGGSEFTTITGNAFHQIQTAISAAASNDAGLSINGNRFSTDNDGNDVTTYFIGDDGITNSNGQDKNIVASRFLSVTSDSVYTDVFKIKGEGFVELQIFGIVQGVGACNYYRKFLLSSTTTADIDTAVTSGGSFDVQLAASGGYLVVSAKRASGVGTSVTAFVTLSMRGQCVEFKKA